MTADERIRLTEEIRKRVRRNIVCAEIEAELWREIGKRMGPCDGEPDWMDMIVWASAETDRVETQHGGLATWEGARAERAYAEFCDLLVFAGLHGAKAPAQGRAGEA